jgi:ATP-binding cassette, subfamily B (MDR/TAP), member 1
VLSSLVCITHSWSFSIAASAFIFAAVSGDLGASTDSADFMDSVRQQAFAFMALGAVILLSMTMQSFLAEMAAAEMSLALKYDWFRALLRQDLAYYDSVDVSGQGTMITINANKYRKGVGKKLSLGIQFLVTFVGSLAYSLYSSWHVTLVIVAIGPLFMFAGLFVVKMNTSATARSTASYAKAGSIVQSSVSGIRTVLSLNAVDIMIEKFNAATKEAYEGAVSQVGMVGLANGSIMASMLLAYFVVLLFGAFLLYDQVRDDGCDPSGNVDDNETCKPSGLGVFGALLGMTFGASILPQASATIEWLVNARVACYPAFAVMRRVTHSGMNEAENGQVPAELDQNGQALPPYTIDSSSDEGLQPTTIHGELEFRGVSFRYPARPDVQVLRNFSLKLEAGKSIALVGFSGSGKSTVVQLIERFYDPTTGSVTLDGVDLRQLNIKWLRQSIALVQQEPKLFECSIRKNIALGLPGASDKDVESAARMANAHDFIVSFPKGYDTEVGALGDQLSGGQRQRICIARSLIKKPKILLLDESTSALDSESEATVQEALEELMKTKSMTTLGTSVCVYKATCS